MVHTYEPDVIDIKYLMTQRITSTIDVEDMYDVLNIKVNIG